MKKTIKEKITICIPTKNRSDFLFRLLNYFADTEYQHWIFIGDSSDEFHFSKTTETIKKLKGRIKIKQFLLPGLIDVGAISHINQFIKTPYSAFLADDDFLCTVGINKCLDFLESNPDYGVAHGLGIATRTDTGGPFGKISHIRSSSQATLNADSASQRLKDYFAEGPYSLIFSVHRTPIWQKMHQGFYSQKPWARQGFIFGELIQSSISSILSKVKELDCLYLVRFGHSRVCRQVKTYDWFRDPAWLPGFKYLQERVIAELMRQDGISKQEAEEVFKQAIQPYLDRLSLRANQSFKQKTLPSLVKKIDHQIPGFKKTCLRIMHHFESRKEINLLHSLLKPTSPYYQDFLPIYQAITRPKNDKL